MAGDQISATTQYYYQNAVTNTTGNNLTTSIVTALIQSILGSPATTGLDKGNTTPISTELNADPNFISATAPDANNAAGTNPKAYMTIVFFDERFNYVAENSMALRVSQQGDNAAPLVLANIKAPKNGFAYIYLSNESSEPVYFDNFTVSDNRGRIIEEDHYYAFGLKIAGISSKKLPDPNEGSIDNKNLYNDKELFDDADLDWYDYGFRNYDAQIGRFPQLDPLTDDYPELTNYQYASNEPIANVDRDGLEKLNAVADFTYSYTRTASEFVFPTLSKAAAPIATGAAKLGARAAIPLLSTTLNIINRSVQDNTFIKKPIQNLQINSGNELSQASKPKKLREEIPYIIPKNEQNVLMFHEGSTLLKDIRRNSDIMKYRMLQGAAIVEGSGLIILGGVEATPLLLETATDQSIQLYYILNRSFNLLSEDFFLALRWQLRRVLSVDNLIRLEKLADKQRDIKKLYDQLKKIKELLDNLSKLKR